MKIDRIFALTGISALFLSAFAFKPKTDVPLRYMKITDVERTDSTLRMGVRLQNRPHFWVYVPATTRLIDTSDTTRQFKITGAENLTLDEKVWLPETGWHEGTLIFEKVPAEVKVVDMMESDITDVRNNILGIHLDEEDTNVVPRLVTAATASFFPTGGISTACSGNPI